jgi:hypothetical protein
VTKEDGSLFPKPATASRLNIIFEAAVVTSLTVAVLSLFLFAWIGNGVAHDRTVGFDFAIRNQVHAYASPGLTKAMIAISFLGGDGLTAAAILSVIAFLALQWRRAALWMVVTILGALVLDLSRNMRSIALVLSHFSCPRPALTVSQRAPLFSFCFYGVLAGLLTRRTDSQIARLDTGCSAGRGYWLVAVYLGYHPSDVIAGYRSHFGEHAGSARSCGYSGRAYPTLVPG